MVTSKSKSEKIATILAIARGEVNAGDLKKMLNPVCILWDEDDLSSEENIYILGSKRVSYDKFKEVVNAK